MVFLRRTTLLRYLLLSAMLALLLFVSSLWLPQAGVRECGSAWQPCLSSDRQAPEPPLVPAEWAGPDKAPPLIQECPGQSFQAWRLLLYLKSSLSDDDDVLLEPYLQSWDQLINFMESLGTMLHGVFGDDASWSLWGRCFMESLGTMLHGVFGDDASWSLWGRCFMESLGTMVSFFSQKVKEKMVVIRELSLKHSREAHGKRSPSDFSGPKSPAYLSVRSMVAAELKAGLVDFSRRTDSGCRTLLRLHRSLLWLKLMLEGLSEGPDADGHFKTPGELSRDAYRVALAPHHPWVLRQAAEFVFLALPDRKYFLQLVCVEHTEEAAPVLRIIIHALTLVHTRTQRILSENDMLELP